MIENKTSYSEALKYIVGKDIPTFELVRDVAIAILQNSQIKFNKTLMTLSTEELPCSIMAFKWMLI